MKYFKAPYRLSFVYLAIFLLLWLIHSVTFVFFPNADTGAGHAAFFMTFPWSLLSTLIADATGYITWSGSFIDSNRLLYGFFSMLNLLPAALINAALLYAASRKSSSTSVKAK